MRRVWIWIVLVMLGMVGSVSNAIADDCGFCAISSAASDSASISQQEVSALQDAATVEIRYRDLSTETALALATDGPQRPVVVEEFTATWCPYCYSVGSALDRLREEYTDEELIIIAYHISDEYTIYLDTMRYGARAVTGIPTVWLDGYQRTVGGYPVSSGETGILSSYVNLKSLLNVEFARVQNNPQMQVQLMGGFDPNSPSFTAIVRNVSGFTGTVNLFVLLAEDRLAVNASNGQTEISFVPRAFVSQQSLSYSGPGEHEVALNYSYSYTYENANHLRPIVFVESNSTKEILGAAAVFSELAASSSWMMYE